MEKARVEEERGRKPLQIVHVRNKTVLYQDCRSDYRIR